MQPEQPLEDTAKGAQDREAAEGIAGERAPATPRSLRAPAEVKEGTKTARRSAEMGWP